MKNIVLVLIYLFFIGCSSSGYNFSGYRNSPFQWVYPEYYYTAEVIKIPKKAPTENFKKINFFGLSTYVPEQYQKSDTTINDTTIYFKEDSSKLFFVSLEDESMLLGDDYAHERNRDYYSAFHSAKEWCQKLFTLTPDTIDDSTTTGDLWLIHGKGMLFEDTDKIEIYQNDDLTAYVRYIKAAHHNLNMEIVFFHNKLPEHKFIRVGFKNVKISARQFLETLD